MSSVKKIFSVLIFILTCFFGKAISQNSYERLVLSIQQSREKYCESYQNATDSIAKMAVLKEAQTYLINTLCDSIFPCWYNTKWDYNGTTTIPGKGHIACGYFITTTLRDLGFHIPRIKWAQKPSESMIRKMCGQQVKRFHNASVDEVRKYIIKSGKGVYLVGLDDHVGFISNRQEILFTHSSYYRPEIGVMTEPLEGWNPFFYSKYRVIGKLFDQNMVEKWLSGVEWE